MIFGISNKIPHILSHICHSPGNLALRSLLPDVGLNVHPFSMLRSLGLETFEKHTCSPAFKHTCMGSLESESLPISGLWKGMHAAQLNTCMFFQFTGTWGSRSLIPGSPNVPWNFPVPRNPGIWDLCSPVLGPCMLEILNGLASSPAPRSSSQATLPECLLN